MQNPKLVEPEAYLHNERLTMLISHLLVVLMMACVGITVMQIAQAFVPQWFGSYLPYLFAFISLESMYTWRIMRRQSDLYVSGFVYHLVEAIVLLSLAKIFIIVWNGLHGRWVNFASWELNFAETFFDAETFFVIITGVMVWAISRFFARDLAEIEGDERLLRATELQHIRSDRLKTRQVLVSRILTLGLAMVFVTSLVRLDYEALWGDQFTRLGSVVNIIIYFVLAMAFLAQTHLAALRASWALDQVPISKGLAQRWWVVSLIFLSAVALVALLLPTRYSIGFLSSLGYFLSIIGYFLSTMVTLILLPVYLLMSWIFSLFSTDIPESPTPPGGPPEFIPPPGMAASDIPWLEVIKSLLFWGVFVGIVGFAFFQYLRQNKALLLRLQELPGMRWLFTTLQRFLAGFKSANRKLRTAVRAGFVRFQMRESGRYAKAGSLYINLRRLSPREKVIFFYLALLRRGKESGLPRNKAQTPNEYAELLEEHVSESREDLHSLTGAFLEARYSRHTITPQDANQVARYWNHLRKALRKRLGGAR